MNDVERPVEAVDVNTKRPVKNAERPVEAFEVEDEKRPAEAVDIKPERPVEDEERPVKAVMINTKRPVTDLLKDKNGPRDFVKKTKPPAGARTAIDECLGGSQGDIAPCPRPGDDTGSDTDNLMKKIELDGGRGFNMVSP